MNHAELRAAAEAATPGPWEVYQREDEQWVQFSTRETDDGDVCGVEDSTFLTSENAAYIAAASPDVMLGLLDEVEALTFALSQAWGVEPVPDELREMAQAWLGQKQQKEKLVAALQYVVEHVQRPTYREDIAIVAATALASVKGDAS